MLLHGRRESNHWWKADWWKRLQPELAEGLVERLKVFRDLMVTVNQAVRQLTGELEAKAPQVLPKGMGRLTYEAVETEVPTPSCGLLIPVVPPEFPRSLAAVPLIGDKRYCGETPGRIRACKREWTARMARAAGQVAWLPREASWVPMGHRDAENRQTARAEARSGACSFR